MKSKRHILTILLAIVSVLGAAAQQSVESAIKSLENSKSVTNEVYSEKRNPSNKAIVRSDRMFEFTDNKIASKIIEAIRKERSKAAAFQMNTAAGQAVYTITFDNGKGPYAKYSLIQNGSGWVLAIVKSNGSSSKSRKHDDSSFLEIPADAFKSLRQLDGLREKLRPLEQLGNNFQNMQYDYIDGGKTLAISFAGASSWDDFNNLDYTTSNNCGETIVTNYNDCGNYDCDGNLVTIYCTDSGSTVKVYNSSCTQTERTSKQRELAAKQRKLAAEQRKLAAKQRQLAAKQREEAARQRKLAAEQRRLAARQRAEAARQRAEAARQRAKAAEKRTKAAQRWAANSTSNSFDGDTSFYTVSYTRD